MRVTTPSTADPKGEPFDFEGRSVRPRRGDSLGAALLAVGERVCRTTPSREPRGLFCGIGVCQDCLVTVDGVPNQRACMTAARGVAVVERQEPFAGPGVPSQEVADMGAPGQRVEGQGAPPQGAHDRGAPRHEVVERDETMDVLVIGGGPAGLAAAAVAAEAGLDVVLVDERGKLGGQYYKQPADVFTLVDASVDRQIRRGRALIDRVQESGARVLSGVTVWAAYGPSEVMALGSDANYVLRPKRLIVATGAYDRAVPMPGWTLPGFMTTGAAQALLRAYQVAPGERVVISGNGPLNIQLAAELTRAGVEVVALAELAAAPSVRSAGRLAAMLWNAPDLLRDGAAYLRTLRRAGVFVQYGHSVIAASGKERVEQATLASIDGQGRPVPGTERVLEVDAVCAGFGFLPSNDVPRALGCRHRFDGARGHLVAVRDHYGRTSVEGVAVVGDGGGIGGGRLAVAQGILAGVDAARSLGVDAVRSLEVDAARSLGVDAARGLRGGDAKALARETRRAQRTVRRQERFQRALWSLYDAPLLVDQFATDDTHICRCEEVTRGTIREAMEDGVQSLGAIKRLTRAGMGRCQGRYCAGIMAGMLPAHGAGGGAGPGARAPNEMDFFAPRAPFKPVPIGAVASGRFTDSEMAQRGKEDGGAPSP